MFDTNADRAILADEMLKAEAKAMRRGMKRGLEKGMEKGMQKGLAQGMEKGMEEGVVRPIKIPIFKMMMEAALEQFFQRDILVRNKISYADGLLEVVDILIDGIIAK